MVLDLIEKVATDGHMDALALVDTFGVVSPHAMKFFVRGVKERFPDTRLETHFHQDFGCGVANTLFALAEGAEVVHSLEEALRLARAAGETELFILGGGEIYALAMPLADRIYLTVVHAEPEGDARFPVFDEHDWELVDDERHPADERHAHAFTFRRYDRRR